MSDETGLVFAGDEDVALPLAVAMYSALVNLRSGASPNVYFLDCGVSEATRERLVEVIQRAQPAAAVQWVQVSADRFDELMDGGRITAATFGRISAATYARLLLSELVPARVRRLVYLDADILVRGDVGQLLALDLDGAPVGAVRDFVEDTTFNAGVLVIDMDRWRSDGLGEQALRYAAENRVIDQHALNAVVPKWHELAHEWNVQNGNLFFAGLHGLAERPAAGVLMDELERRRWELIRSAGVLHFVGGVKPWNRLCPLPGTTSWVLTMARSRWFPPGRTLAWLLRYAVARARYWLGTMRLMAISRIRRGRSRP